MDNNLTKWQEMSIHERRIFLAEIQDLAMTDNDFLAEVIQVKQQYYAKHPKLAENHSYNFQTQD